MTINLNYVPWMTFLGLLGLGSGYLIGKAMDTPNTMASMLYGMCGGCLVGIVVRIMLRYRDRPSKDSDPSAEP